MSYGDIQRAILLVLGLYLLLQLVQAVTSVLLLFFAVILLAMALNPIVAWLAGHRVPRPLGAALVGLAILALGGIVGWIVIPPLVVEAQQLIVNLPQYWDLAQARVQDVADRFPLLRERLGEGGSIVRSALEYGSQLIQRAGRLTVTAASLVVALFVALLLTVYTLASPCPLLEGFLAGVPASHREQTRNALVRISQQMRAWVSASLILGAVVGFLAWLGLVLLGVPNALLLAVLAFLGEFIPTLGPLITGAPAVVLALTISPATALWVLILYIAIQQIEANVLHPLIMGGRLEMHPVSIAFFILVMGTLAGILGALLAVPIAAIVKTLYEEFYLKPRNPDMDAVEEDANDVLAA